MSKTPGTVSKILWHFTGGGYQVGDDPNERTNLKPQTKAIEILSKILKSKVLRVGGLPESIKVSNLVLSVEDFDDGKELVSKYEHWIKPTSEVVCLADIPIQHLSYHAERYGKVAIGFHRQSVLDENFVPVFYVNHHSGVARSLAAVDRLIEGRGNPEIVSSIADFMDLSDEARSVCFDFLASYLKYPSRELQPVLSNLKTFGYDQFKDIYCEREWRSTRDFEFQISAVAMIVMPRRAIKDFLDHHKDLPREIPIVSWEDLIEH
jgi:hypothetical protein